MTEQQNIAEYATTLWKQVIQMGFAPNVSINAETNAKGECQIIEQPQQQQS